MLLRYSIQLTFDSCVTHLRSHAARTTPKLPFYGFHSVIIYCFNALVKFLLRTALRFAQQQGGCRRSAFTINIHMRSAEFQHSKELYSEFAAWLADQGHAVDDLNYLDFLRLLGQYLTDRGIIQRDQRRKIANAVIVTHSHEMPGFVEGFRQQLRSLLTVAA